jgi:hypothetical protein
MKKQQITSGLLAVLIRGGASGGIALDRLVVSWVSQRRALADRSKLMTAQQRRKSKHKKGLL